MDVSAEDVVNNVFTVGEQPIDRISRQRSIEAPTEPDNGVPKLSPKYQITHIFVVQ